MLVDPVISLAAALVLAWILATAGLHKLRDRARFSASLAAYDLLPAALVPLIALLLPVVEVCLAAALLVPVVRAPGALVVALLLLSYTLAIAINLARGRRAIDCGCGGPDERQPLNGWLLLRNGVLIGLALLVATPGAVRDSGWLDWSVAVLAALAAALIHAAGNRLLANRELLSNLVRAHGHA